MSAAASSQQPAACSLQPAANSQQPTANSQQPAGLRSRLILFAGRTSQALARLYFDIAPLLAADPRLSVAWALIPGSRFESGSYEFAEGAGIDLLPWTASRRLRPALVITSSPDPCLYEVDAPVLSLPHGAGHNRLRPELSGVSGLSPEQIQGPNGEVPDFMALPGPAAARRLAIDCPTAVSNAAVTGDVCLERLRTSAVRRDDFRRALGVEPHQRLVVLSSTWDQNALTRSNRTLPERLLAELPMDEYRLAFIPHPNDEVADTPRPTGFLRPYLENGLVMIPPEEGWRATLVAADCLIGDHGSVTYMGATIGLPVLLAAFGFANMPRESPLARFGRIAPRFDRSTPAAPQIRRAIESGPVDFDYADALAEPDTPPSARITQRACELLGIEPAAPTGPEHLPTPDLLPRCLPTSAWHCRIDPEAATWSRHPASVPSSGPGHLVADLACRDPRLRDSASVLLLHRDPVPASAAVETLRSILDKQPVCRVASARTAADEASVVIRDGMSLRVRTDPRRMDLLPSALYAATAPDGSSPLRLDAVHALDLLRRFDPGLALLAAEDRP
ncbi:hypothetical protein [Glycomyces buryatensis]|uniref:Uncharacterized protein n=1 Tax=Glycomyces buryatensis TaxID=2570927 RepID=A0A4S8QBA5_9ACTN|nr:hypothetical protein [Glycomyces buryatensis]THV40095.1 hypothetical protein FAB82_16345 [Glycomyces buryatensis]